MGGGRKDRPRDCNALARMLLTAAVVSLTTLAAHESPAQPDDAALVPSQPNQPTHGPGSSDYPHAGFRMSKHGTGAGQFWIFTPDEPTPKRAPVVVFLHGWGTLDPDIYGAWIKHLVRRGNILIYPRYQESLRSLPRGFAENAVIAIRDAISRTQAGEVQPNLEKLAFVGHSMGAIISANISQNAARLNLPRPRVLFLAEPAFEPIVANYDQIPAETLLVIAVGADLKRDSSARRILQRSTLIPNENKNYVALPSDLHGNPPLISDHFAPYAADQFDDAMATTPGNQWRGLTRNALDYLGYWKLCDGLLDAAFFDRNRHYVLTDSPELRFMGLWSDGTPVKEAVIMQWNDRPVAAANNR